MVREQVSCSHTTITRLMRATWALLPGSCSLSCERRSWWAYRRHQLHFCRLGQSVHQCALHDSVFKESPHGLPATVFCREPNVPVSSPVPHLRIDETTRLQTMACEQQTFCSVCLQGQVQFAVYASAQQLNQQT